ncbi:MAG: prenyltransferase, partial [Muribaculum sp.]|nr:prenyltransferase [Candidatus Merdivivens faecigallinarum]
MEKHTFKEWMIAVRPWSFPASAMPVAVTLGYVLANHQQADWLNGLWALLN